MEGRGRIDLRTAIDQWGRNVGNRHLSERQMVKLCERFGQDYALLRRHEGTTWDGTHRTNSAKESSFCVVGRKRCR
jgi:hypothetical protein